MEKLFDYRDWLASELQTRKSKNPFFSLRGFSRKIGVSPATLSQLLSGKRRLTERTALKIVECLGLDESMKQRFMAASKADKAFSDVQQMSRWYHELTSDLANFINSGECPDPIAAKLKSLLQKSEELFPNNNDSKAF